MTLKLPVLAVLKPTVEETSIWVFPVFPDFVVMMITPLAALEPYRPVAAASLRTVTDSISFGLAFPSMIPSTTYNGLAPALIELDPLMTILDDALGSPDELETITPAAFPCSSPVTSLDVTSFSFSPETTATELDSWESCLEE